MGSQPPLSYESLFPNVGRFDRSFLHYGETMEDKFNHLFGGVGIEFQDVKQRYDSIFTSLGTGEILPDGLIQTGKELQIHTPEHWGCVNVFFTKKIHWANQVYPDETICRKTYRAFKRGVRMFNLEIDMKNFDEFPEQYKKIWGYLYGLPCEGRYQISWCK